MIVVVVLVDIVVDIVVAISIVAIIDIRIGVGVVAVADIGVFVGIVAVADIGVVVGIVDAVGVVAEIRSCIQNTGLSFTAVVHPLSGNGVPALSRRTDHLRFLGRYRACLLPLLCRYSALYLLG